MKLIACPPMGEELYSVRMRAEQSGRHCSGAERVALAAGVPQLVTELVARAMACGVPPDAVHCTIEQLSGDILIRKLPAVRTFEVPDLQTGRRCARALLLRAGVAPIAVDVALKLLAAGPAPGGRVMRGAMIIDALSGNRLEPDPARGVRASRMDLAPAARDGILAELAAAGLEHRRTAEALALAGKILQAPGIVGELCWSDDPSYLAGYVAAPGYGYQRITRLKEAGDGFGGRALFVRADRLNLEALITFLENQAMLFDAVGAIAPPQPWEG